jgi:hypothetical protein
LTLSSASNASISDATGTLTIVDNDAEPSISINNNSMTENAANLSFTVSLSAASGQAVTVSYATANSSATAGADYTAVSATTLTFAAGETSKTINIAVLEDSIDENNETFVVNLSSPSNATISDSQGIGTIIDDPEDTAATQPSLSINNVSLTEDATNMTFTVTASDTYSSNVTFSYATASGTATSGSDFTAASGTGTITAGSTTTTITVPILEDTNLEADEIFYVNLSSPSNATISDSQGIGTIIDEDCDADNITYVNSDVSIIHGATNFRHASDSSSGQTDDGSGVNHNGTSLSNSNRFVITQERANTQWSGSNSATFDTSNVGSNSIVYGRNKAGTATTTSVTDDTYFNSYLIYLNENVNRRASSQAGTVRFEHNIMGIYIDSDDTTSTPSNMTQFEKSGATYSTSSSSGAGNRGYEFGNSKDWITMTTSGTYAYKEITFGAKNGAKGDYIRVITNSCLTDGIVEGAEYTTSSGLTGFTDQEGNFSHYVGDDVTFNVGGVVLGTATAEDLALGRVFLQDIADVDRTNLNDHYLENMATFLQSLDNNNDAYDNIIITQEMRDALAEKSLDLRTASDEEVQRLIEDVGGTWVEEGDAMTHVKDMLIKYSALTEADFDSSPRSSTHGMIDTIDTDSIISSYKDNNDSLEEVPSYDSVSIEMSDLLDGFLESSADELLTPNDEVGEELSNEGESSVMFDSSITLNNFMDTLLIDSPVTVDII